MADFNPTYRAEIDNLILEGRVGGKPVEFSFNSFVGHKDSGAGILGGYIHDADGAFDPRPFAYEIDLPEGFDDKVRKSGQFRAPLAAAEIEKMGFDPADIARNKIDLKSDDFEDLLRGRLALTHAEKIKPGEMILTHGEGDIRLGGEVSQKGHGQFGHIDPGSGRFAQATEFVGDTAKRLSGTAGMFAGAVAGGMVLMDGGSMGEAFAATGDAAAITVDAAEGNYWGVAQTIAGAGGGAAGMAVGATVGSAVPFGGTLAGAGAGMVAGDALGAEAVIEAASFGSGDFRARLEAIELPPHAQTQFSQGFIDMHQQAKYIAHREAQDFAGREDNAVLPDFMSPEFTEMQEKMMALEDAKEGFETMYGQARIDGTLDGLHTQLTTAETMTQNAPVQTAEFNTETPSVTTSGSLKM